MFLFVILLSIVALTESEFCSIDVSATPHKVSLCTMVHNEAWYIEEWVAYHLLIGVDHFYIYDDESTDIIKEVLGPYINKGIVSLIPWSHTSQTVDPRLVEPDPAFTRPQRFAIADCLFNHKYDSEWFGIWDMDEFAFMGDSFATLPEFLRVQGQLTDDYEIPITTFGSQGFTSTPNGLVISNYMMRNNLTVFGMAPGDDNKFSGKSIYKSGCGLPNVHFSDDLIETDEYACRKYRAGWVTVDGDRSHLPLTINHYAIKSWEHFKEKTKKWHFGLNKTVFDTNLQTSNTLKDDSMLKFVEPIQALMDCAALERNKTIL